MSKPTSKPATKPAEKPADRSMTEGQRAYEAKRAAKAGMSLDKWMGQKERERLAEQREREREAAKAALPPKKPGFFSRLIAKAEKPLR